MKVINKTYTISSSVENVWRGLTDLKVIEKWSGSRCVMSEKEGSNFSLWDGDIWGKNIEVVSGKKLVQEWYAGKWNEPSIVVFELSGNQDSTILKLEHTNIPEKEFEGIDSGWDDYYLEPLKVLVESM